MVNKLSVLYLKRNIFFLTLHAIQTTPKNETNMIRILGDHNSLFNQFVAEIRDKSVQQDSMRFRRNLQRLGEIFAYEISKTMNYYPREIQTPLGTSDVNLLDDQVVLSTIMRAGLPLHQGFLNYFDNAQNAFISAFRKYDSDGEFDVKFEFLSGPPDISDKVLILCDAMLATGSSMVLAYKALLERGAPKNTHIVAIIASKEGVDHMKKYLKRGKTTLWVGAIDDELTSKAYIVPGLGDAGDLAFGEK